ncbi:hypothetical protein CF319_g5107 [Tilletia indica]|nr:hypothetical protein CF319_g5107 [Tilletia indica]
MTGTPNRSGGRGGDASISGSGSGSRARAPQKSPVRKPVLATPSPECSSYLRMAGSGRPDSTQHASPYPFSTASASSSRLLPFDASTSDLYARAQAMGLKLSREDLERTRAGVAAIVKRNRTSPASSVITHPHASSPPYLPPSAGGPSSRKVTTPHSGSSSVRRAMALSSGGSNSNSSAPRPTLEQVSLRKEQDGDDRRRKRQRRISETTPIQPFLQPGQLHTFTHPPYHHYHHHQHNILSSSSSQFIDFSSPISHFDPSSSSSAPRWKFMDRSGRPRTRPRMTLDEVGVRSEEGSDEKRKARRRRRTAEESGAELTDTDSIRHDDDDMLPLLLSLQPTHAPSSLYAGRTRNIAEDSLAELTDTDSVRPEEDEMLPLLLSHQPSELSSSALLPTAPPSAAPIQSDDYLPSVITSPSAPSVAKQEPIAEEPIAEEPQPSSAADLSLSLSKSRSDMDEEGDTSINQSASAMDETMEAWDYTDGTRVVKLISDELAKGLREGTISESDIEPRYFTLPVHWGKEKAKPSHASYAGLIGLAILSSSDGKLGLAEIYQWINTTFPHYEMRDRGWQNSIRHNLSLNKSFVKVERNVLEKGKGALWSIAPGHECRFENGTYNAKKATVSKPSANGHDGTDDEADDEGEADDSKGHVGSSSGASLNASGSRGGMSTSTADALALMKKHGGSQVLCYTMRHGTSHKYYRVKRDPVQDVAKGLAVAVAPVITISTTAGGTITPNVGGNTSLPLLVPPSEESVRTESGLSSGSLLSTPARPTASQPAKRGRRPGGAPSKAAQAAVLSQAVSKAETAAARAAAKVGVVASQEPAPVPVAVRGRKRIPLKDKTNVGPGAKGVPAKAAIAAPAPFSASAAKGKGKAEDPVKVTTTSFPQISMGAPFHSPSAPAGPSMMGAFTPGPAGSSNSSTRWPMRSPISSLRSSMGGALKSGSGSVMLPIAGLTPARRILGGHAGLGSQFSPLFNTPGGLGPGIGMDLGIGVGGSNNTMGFGSLRSAAMGAGTGLGSVMSPVHPLSSVLQTPARGMLSGSAMGSVGGDDSGAHGRHRRRESSGVGGGGIDGPTPLSVGGNNQWFFSSTPIRRLMSGAGSESAGRAGLSNSGPMSSPISSSIHERTGSPYARSNRSHASSGAGSGSGGGGSMIGGHPSSSIGSTSTPSAAVPGGNRSTGLTPAGDAHWLGDPFGYQGNFSHELAFTTEMGGLGTGIDSSPAKDLWRS